MRDFAAIDFETANFQFTSVCSVGVVIVRNGEISDSFYSLIQPEPNYYNRLNTSIHGRSGISQGLERGGKAARAQRGRCQGVGTPLSATCGSQQGV